MRKNTGDRRGPDLGPAGLLILSAMLLCVFLVAIVGIPMAVYGIGVLRSLGFNLINVVLGGTLQLILQFVVLGSIPSFDPQVVQQIIPQPTPTAAEIDALRERLRERQAALARRHEALEIRRKHLPSGNEEARADYDRDRAAYEQELEQLRTEAAALPPR